MASCGSGESPQGEIMKTTKLEEQIAAIQRMSRSELRALWLATFGEEPRSGNNVWMRKRLCWGIQAQQLGGLSEAAKKRIEELTPLALASMPWGFRSFPERDTAVSLVERGRSALTPGTVLTRKYKGKTIVVTVRDNGKFEYGGAIYGSLSAVAKAVTGSHWNGNLFFGISGRRKTA